MELRKFVNIDVIESLKKIMEQNTSINIEFFDSDIEILKKAASTNKKKRFLWMSHKRGTWCLGEREAYIHGTPENLISWIPENT